MENRTSWIWRDWGGQGAHGTTLAVRPVYGPADCGGFAAPKARRSSKIATSFRCMHMLNGEGRGAFFLFFVSVREDRGTTTSSTAVKQDFHGIS